MAKSLLKRLLNLIYSEYKKQFKSAHQAVKFYTELSIGEYYDRYGIGPSEARQERLQRRLVPVFKNMLK